MGAIFLRTFFLLVLALCPWGMAHGSSCLALMEESSAIIQARTILRVNEKLQELISENALYGGGSCSFGQCAYFSIQLYKALRNDFLVSSVGVRWRIDRRLFHMFVVVHSSENSAEEIIVDSTYKQFFHPRLRPKLPNFFVGTRSDLIALFKQHETQLLPICRELAPTGFPERFVELQYGFGAGEGLREHGDVIAPRDMDRIRVKH